MAAIYRCDPSVITTENLVVVYKGDVNVDCGKLANGKQSDVKFFRRRKSVDDQTVAEWIEPDGKKFFQTDPNVLTIKNLGKINLF